MPSKKTKMLMMKKKKVISEYQITEFGTIENIIIFLMRVVFVVMFPFSYCLWVTVANEYERVIPFRLGKCTGIRGPGMVQYLPMIDHIIKVDIRTVSFDVPSQEVLTRDSVTVWVDAVVYYRIVDPVKSVVNVASVTYSTKLLAQTTLLNDLGQRTLSQLLTDRDQISKDILAVLDESTDDWGIKVERVEIKDMKLPKEIQRVMAAEAEAIRTAKANIIAAEGEQNASKALKDAAEVISSCKGGIQLRYLQTLATISNTNNQTIVIPIPPNIFENFKM